ncbi:MAG: hypothetical protein EAZ95_10410 [Bacteroidetes bacterium]|nr:MAG: hypothetical protein EAZ95_10410 [Bacteroidota bacterium]
MATATLSLVTALRRTTQKLRQGAKYQWGHMGQCNCGNLAQELIHMTEAEIHAHALQTREGDWSEQTAAYCPNSALPMDAMITRMLEHGLTQADLQHLEKLTAPEVLARMPAHCKYPRHNVREDTILYLDTWAKLLEDQLLETIELPEVWKTQPSQEIEHLIPS